MPARHPLARRRLEARRAGRFVILVGLAVLIPVLPLSADPAPGFVENWPGTSLQGWGGGASYSNPGTGGVEGAGDGFLIMSTSTATKLAGFSTGSEYAGNWQAAGVTQVRLWLNDVNTDEALEIHFVIGNATNFWIYNPGFHPPEQSWAEFTVDLTSPVNFTQIIGPGTFDQALQNVDRIQLRHDTVPFMQSPDNIQGDVGIDRLLLSSNPVRVEPGTWGRIKMLYR